MKPEPLIEDKGMLRKTIKVADIAAEVTKERGRVAVHEEDNGGETIVWS